MEDQIERERVLVQVSWRGQLHNEWIITCRLMADSLTLHKVIVALLGSSADYGQI